MHSALAMLASSSGVSSERSAFMNLVRNEIDRLNDEIGARGSLTLMFQRGNIKASTASLELAAAWLVQSPNNCQAAAGVCDKHSQDIPVALQAVELARVVVHARPMSGHWHYCFPRTVFFGGMWPVGRSHLMQAEDLYHTMIATSKVIGVDWISVGSRVDRAPFSLC